MPKRTLTATRADINIEIVGLPTLHGKRIKGYLLADNECAISEEDICTLIKEPIENFRAYQREESFLHQFLPADLGGCSSPVDLGNGEPVPHYRLEFAFCFWANCAEAGHANAGSLLATVAVSAVERLTRESYRESGDIDMVLRAVMTPMCEEGLAVAEHLCSHQKKELNWLLNEGYRPMVGGNAPLMIDKPAALPGVYVIAGPADENGNSFKYVGQSKDIRNRIKGSAHPHKTVSDDKKHSPITWYKLVEGERDRLYAESLAIGTLRPSLNFGQVAT